MISLVNSVNERDPSPSAQTLNSSIQVNGGKKNALYSLSDGRLNWDWISGEIQASKPLLVTTRCNTSVGADAFFS